MKTLKCSDLGGPANCQVAVSGATFAELASQCQAHVMHEVSVGDEAHQAAVERMKSLAPEAQRKEFASYQAKFAAAPDA